MAYIMMQGFVKERLVSPASAKFPRMNNYDVKIQKDEHIYFIQGYVDSQNSFGAMLRTYYSGAVIQEDEKYWSLFKLDFDE